MNNKELKDLQSILAMQNDIIQKMNNKIEEIELYFSSNEEVANNIDKLEKIIEEIEDNIKYLSIEDFEDWNENLVDDIYELKRKQIKDELKKIEYKDWDSYVCECIKYCSKNNLDPFTPYEAFLSQDDLDLIKSEQYKDKYKWEKIDYLMVGLAGFLGALTEILIVKIPKDMNVGIYKGQSGSEVTKFLKILEFPKWVQDWLENFAKVSYDNTGGSTHRIDTPGHDPILGLVFGVVDILLGNATTVKNGNIDITKVTQNTNIIEAIIKQLVHLISDVATNKGLPVPFASVFRMIDIGEFKRANGKTSTVSDMARWMYYHGYDLRHFATMSITPAVIEIIIRAYIMIRHYIEGKDDNIKIKNNPKYRSMLLSSHAIASATNAGKVVLSQGNPLAINYAQWLALLRYLLPSMKYWLFDNENLKLEFLDGINDNLWDELTENSINILNKVNYDYMPIFEMGNIK